MLKNLKDSKAATDALLALLPTSGTLAGIAVGLAGLINGGSLPGVATLADDMLLVSALGFLMTCYLIFFAVRHADRPYASVLVQAIDALFLVALTLVVLSGFVAAYSLL